MYLMARIMSCLGWVLYTFNKVTERFLGLFSGTKRIRYRKNCVQRKRCSKDTREQHLGVGTNIEVWFGDRGNQYRNRNENLGIATQ